MTWYVVVTRDRHHLPVQRFVTIEAAGNYVVKEMAMDRWTVMAQDGSKNTPLRELTHRERLAYERTLWPTLYD